VRESVGDEKPRWNYSLDDESGEYVVAAIADVLNCCRTSIISQKT
jgi:hypothetical protein